MAGGPTGGLQSEFLPTTRLHWIHIRVRRALPSGVLKTCGDSGSAASLGNLSQLLLDLLKFITILLAFASRAKSLKNTLKNFSLINWCTTLHKTIWPYDHYSIPFLHCINFGLPTGLWGFQEKNCILLLVQSPTWEGKKKKRQWGMSFNSVETMAWLFSRLFFFLILLYSFVFSNILFALPNLSCCLLPTFPLAVHSIFIPCNTTHTPAPFLRTLPALRKRIYIFLMFFFHLNAIYPTSASRLSSHLSFSKSFVWCEGRTVM